MNTSDRIIVVGVDGSASSEALLRWARDFALRVGGRLRVVLAWQPPDLASLVPFRVEMSLAKAAERRLAELVDSNASGVGAESSVVEGSPGRALLLAAKDADYLVIGRPEGVEPNRARSTASQCAASSPCPVIIVPISEQMT
ncbi:MAG TPA: universal stress protein [Solirubrobacterales bacterium]|nr:universal stress protein [Solirubrobacterales bacterium]